MEMHQREVGALKMAYDSTQDVTFLQADAAKGEADELRRALEETLAMLERQNVMQVTLEAKYEAAVRDGSDRNAQVHVGLQVKQPALVRSFSCTPPDTRLFSPPHTLSHSHIRSSSHPPAYVAVATCRTHRERVPVTPPCTKS
jgi:hypothetical protein